MLSASIFLVVFRIWSFSAMIECYKFFKLCAILVTLGKGGGVGAANTNNKVAPDKTINQEAISQHPVANISTSHLELKKIPTPSASVRNVKINEKQI